MRVRQKPLQIMSPIAESPAVSYHSDSQNAISTNFYNSEPAGPINNERRVRRAMNYPRIVQQEVARQEAVQTKKHPVKKIAKVAFVAFSVAVLPSLFIAGMPIVGTVLLGAAIVCAIAYLLSK